jgi:para-aminobenzoate synthetase component 1
MMLVEIPFLTVMDAARRLADRPRLAILDSAMSHATLGRWSYVACDPAGVFTVRGGRAAWNGEDLADPPLAALRALLVRHRQDRRPDGPPFQGGAVGTFAYEAAHLFEALPKVPADPTASQIDLGLYDTLLAIDGIERRAILVGRDAARIEALRLRLQAPPKSLPRLPSLAWRQETHRSVYEDQVRRVVRYIRDGDIFQANLSQRFVGHPDGPLDPLAAYQALRTANPAPFGALLVDGPRFIASTSPERFLRVSGRSVEARPIKGTIRRHRDPGQDRRAAARLAASEKDRAENVMIVDLLRNDLSRVCKPTSVAVPALCAVETYASVHHLTSVVTGRLAEGRDALDLVAAAFPGGSITGAPKIRAMEIIAELERRPRGVYCGSVGWLGFDGDMDLNIAIRTAAFDGEALSLNAGGGITLLSDPSAEYEETLAKAERLLEALAPRSALPDEAA